MLVDSIKPEFGPPESWQDIRAEIVEKVPMKKQKLNTQQSWLFPEINDNSPDPVSGAAEGYNVVGSKPVISEEGEEREAEPEAKPSVLT